MELTNPRTGVRLHYLIEGEGEPTIVIMHGWTGNYTRWSPTREMLSKKHRTIIYDLRGHGFSDKSPDLDFSFDSFVADHLGLIEALDIKHSVLAGHSMGGMIAQHFTLAHPEMVDKLILVGTTACPAPDASNMRRLKTAAFLFKHFFEFTMKTKDKKKRKTSRSLSGHGQSGDAAEPRSGREMHYFNNEYGLERQSEESENARSRRRFERRRYSFLSAF